jgi:hypothetical protein
MKCGTVGCIELAEYMNRWDVGLWVGLSWLRVSTTGIWE